MIGDILPDRATRRRFDESVVTEYGLAAAAASA